MPLFKFFDLNDLFDILNLIMKLKLLLLLFLMFFSQLYVSPVYSDGFVLDISVPRVSKFQLIQYHKRIRNGDNIIGQFILENNTIDGYKLSFTSPTNGVLSPESDLDGVISIPYTIWLEKRTGDTPSSVVVNENPDLTTGVAVNVLDSFGFQNGKSNVSYNVHLTIDDPDNLLLMAGYYKESISITYTDY